MAGFMIRKAWVCLECLTTQSLTAFMKPQAISALHPILILLVIFDNNPSNHDKSSTSKYDYCYR